MTSKRRITSALATLALLASVALADVPMARRHIGFARDIIDKNEIGRVEQARNYLRQAELALSNVPEAERAPILAEIQALRTDADVKERAYHVANADRMLEREYVQLKAAAEGTDSRSHLREVEQVEPMFVRMENHLKSEICVKNFSPEHAAEWRQKVDALRGIALRTLWNNVVKEAEDLLQKVEERNRANTEEARKYSEETYEGYLARALKEAEKLPYTDERKQPLIERHKAAVSARARRIALDAKEHTVGAMREWWAHVQQQHQSSWQGWERENAYEFSQWWREHGNMNLEKTENRWEMAQNATEDSRWKEAVEAHGDDPRVKAIVAEVKAIALDSSQKIVAAADKFITGAADKAAAEPDETRDRVLRVVEKLEKFGPSCPEGEAALAKGRALLNRIHELEVNGGGAPTPTATTPAGTPESGRTTTPAGTPRTEGDEDEAESGGGVSFLSLFFGCACCFLFLGAIGGGAFFVMKQQKAAAAAGGAAPPPA